MIYNEHDIQVSMYCNTYTPSICCTATVLYTMDHLFK